MVMQFIAIDPKMIEFDDKIMDSMAQMIRANRNVSERMWMVYPYLYKVFEKYRKEVDEKLLELLVVYL